MEALLRSICTRGDRRRDRCRKFRICGIFFIVLVLFGSVVRGERILRSPPISWDEGRWGRWGKLGNGRTRPVSGSSWVQPHHLFYLHHLRSCASSAWGLVGRDSSPLQPTDWSSDMRIGGLITILVQGLYFRMSTVCPRLFSLCCVVLWISFPSDL